MQQLWKRIDDDILTIWMQNRFANALIVLLSMGVLFYFKFYTGFDLWWTLQVLGIIWIAQYALSFNALSSDAPQGTTLIAIAFRSFVVSIVLSFQMTVTLLVPMFLFVFIIYR